MTPRLAVFLGALALVMAWSLPASATDNSAWDDYDTATEKRGDQFFDASNYTEAEIIYREVLDRHPDSASALLYHVKALNALERYDESLTECRKAIALNPNGGAAYAWLGRTLAQMHRYDEASDALMKSSIRSSAEVNSASAIQTTMIWFAGVDYLKGKQSETEKFFDEQTQSGDAKTNAYNAAIIADFFRQTGHGDVAIQWWKKSYTLGNTDAARYLQWAYNGLTPGFPYDPGESAYWQRRTPDDTYPWFPRLAQADQIVAFAHGWGLVLIILAAAVILPWLTIGIVALIPARGLINEPTFPWMERARRAYPFMVLFATCVVLMPLVDWLNAFEIPGSLLPLPKWLFLLIVTLVGFWATSTVIVHWAPLYRTDAGTPWQYMKDVAISLFLRATVIVIFIIVGVSLPAQFGWRAALTIAAALLAYFYIQFGGWIQLARFIRLLTPADPETVHDAADLAHQRNLPAPRVFTIPWRRPNAFAFPFSNAIVITENLRAHLTREEIKAILAHELAHLCEDRVTSASRLLTPLLLLPIFTMGLWGSYFWVALGGSYLLFLMGAMFMRKRARRMEERADTFGKEAESEAGIYPLALAKLYEANLIPAVMPGKKKVHPHLYDRLLAAGITPDYPRPKPPGRWGAIAGCLAVALHAACLCAIWLCLF